MKQTSTRSRVAARPVPLSPTALLTGSIYGLAAGLSLALLLLSGLLPINWAESFRAGPLVFQAYLAGAGALFGVVLNGLRAMRSGK